VPGFDSIINQERPVRILTNLLHRGNIPHALLFSGIDGTGKKEAAMAMVMGINCRTTAEAAASSDASVDPDAHQGMPPNGTTPAGACGVCAACRKIQSGTHPDIHYLEPAGSAIKIAQIRELAERVALKPYEARHRGIILVDAHKMNASAANALLKLLEEPPERTLFVLTAPQPGDLLPTVASRCQHIRFNPISRRQLQEALIDRHQVTEEEARIVAALAGGSIKRAVEMVQSNWMSRRNWLIREFMALSLKSIHHLLALAEELARSREKLHEGLDILQGWLRDLLIHRYAPDKILNADLMEPVPREAAGWHPEAILTQMKAIETARRRIEANANPRLTCEALLIQIVRSHG
jgi:DNA polymerase-3 subunit delta'